MARLGIDLALGARLADSEKYGDWYRDPWSWPECGATFVEGLDLEEDFAVRKDGGRYRSALQPAFHPFDVPKSFVGMRPAVVQDPKSRLAYISAVAPLSKRLHSDLSSWVFGWRSRDDIVASNNSEWTLYEASQETIAGSDFAAQTDISSFFASINTERIIEAVEALSPRSLSSDIVRVILNAHDGMTTRRGIPQRSLGSSLLAHIALRSIDDVVDANLSSGNLSGARRWMDDISFEGPEDALYALLVAIQAKAREAGLEVNLAKTILTTGPESAARLREEAQKRIVLPRVRRSTGSSGSFGYYLDRTDLEQQEEQVLADPASTSRSLLVAILRSLAYYGMFDRAPDWMAKSRYMPHAADSLGRYLAALRQRGGATSINFESWFIEEVASGWAFPEWVLAQHALTFSPADLPGTVATIFRDWLGSSRNRQQLAVAIHRMAAVEPKTVRSILTSRLDRADDPLVLRLFGLGLVGSGAVERVARSAFTHDSNSLTLKYLESRSWTLPRVANDFDYAESDTFDDEADEDGSDESDSEILLDD